MAGALRRTMVYLGLAESDDEYISEETPRPRESPRSTDGPAAAPSESGSTSVARRSPEYRAPVTPIKRAPSSREDDNELRTITTVHPRSYNDAKSIGEAFRDGTPVIMNVSDMGEAEAKRLVDFAAGLVFALHGSIERVTAKVFLLTPSFVEVRDQGHHDEIDEEPAPLEQVEG
ncbi:cell division protein SepF [Kocuria sp.]|uniref:cell division protein SepF n=1 Tax=Kocuria sp. TaxID=1871328 RepID=UPI0026DCDCDB|nr:cell division protein SepF [Kocuria sp.]MDO4919985.1 cell division protein SepF [Kocuria sp.]